MRHISKKICLEPYISRQCFKIPSYNNEDIDNDGKSKLKKNFKEDECNYGLMPVDIKSLKSDGKGGNERITYRTMMDMYFWMKKYIKLLNTRMACHTTSNRTYEPYENSMEYYKYEVLNKNAELEKYYFDLYQTYLYYSEYIGNKDTFEKFVTEDSANCGIENDGLNSYNGDEIDFSNCIDIPLIITTTIDDIGEYSIFYNEWKEGQRYNKNDLVFYDKKLYKKTKIMSDDEYGSFYSTKYLESYFANEKDLIDEDKEWYDNTENRNLPRVGEILGTDNQWTDISNEYFTNIENPNTENDNYDYANNKKNKEQSIYTVKDGKVIFNPSNNIFENGKISKHFVGDILKITTNNVPKINKDESISYDYLGFFYINNNYYKVFENEYIFFNNNKYLVHRFKAENLNSRYCVVDGIKYYSYYSKLNDGKNQIFKIESDKVCNIKDGYFIEYNKKALHVGDLGSINNELKIETDTNINLYYRFYGYIRYNGIFHNIQKMPNGNFKLFNFIADISTFNNKELIRYSIDTNIKDSTFNIYYEYNKDEPPSLNETGYYIDENNLYFFKPCKTYNNEGKVSGYTESKLSSLMTKPLATDNLGNQLPCAFRKTQDGKVIQPSSENFNLNYLAFPYKMNNTSNLTYIKTEGNDIIFWGNLIKNISLYYLNDKNEKVVERNCTIENEVADITKEIIEENYDNNNIIKTLYCKIEYYVGAIIKLNGNKYEYINNGIKYTEDLIVKEEVINFNITKYDMILVKYYKLLSNNVVIKNNEYSDEETIIPQAYFEFDTFDNENNNPYRDVCNGTIAAPIFREEYKFGSSSLEKIDANIYIDRGISSSFEKHLKLLEINSLESLEQYGNGFYNIIKN